MGDDIDDIDNDMIDDIDDDDIDDDDIEDDEDSENESSNDEVIEEVQESDNVNIEIIVVKPENRITQNKINAFEYARVIGDRAQQIENGDYYYVEVEGEETSIQIAKKELAMGRCPCKIERVLYETETEKIVEHWKVTELITNIII